MKKNWVMIPLIIIFAVLMVFVGYNIKIANDASDMEREERFKRYETAVKDGYKVYYNGAAASGDALGIDKYNIGVKFDITYNDKDKTIVIMPIHYSGGNTYYFIR